MENNEISDIQKFLIAWFIGYGHASDYKEILPSKLFGIYDPLFVHLSKWFGKNPEFYAICSQIGNKYVVDAIKRCSHDFISNRDKYIHKLFDWYVVNDLMSKKSPSEVLEYVSDVYIKLTNIKTWNQWGITKIDTLMTKLVDEIDHAVQYWDKQEWYKTGFNIIDKHAGWLIKGRTIRLSAYANTGKSAFSYAVVNNVLKQWAKVLYFSLEIPKEDLRNRLLSNYYEIPINTFEVKSQLSEKDIYRFADYPLYISSDTFNMSDIEKITAGVKPDIVFIDYVQLIKADGNTEYEQMNDVARRIRKLTSDYNVAVFDLSQVSNDGKWYKKGWVIPSKGSGELVAAASQVYVMEESKHAGRINIHLAKNRHGEKGMCAEYKPNFKTSTFEYMGEFEPETKAF